jgi:hypothetical protein
MDSTASGLSDRFESDSPSRAFAATIRGAEASCWRKIHTVAAVIAASTATAAIFMTQC